jgi:hypothetical protein
MFIINQNLRLLKKLKLLKENIKIQLIKKEEMNHTRQS